MKLMHTCNSILAHGVVQLRQVSNTHAALNGKIKHFLHFNKYKYSRSTDADEQG